MQKQKVRQMEEVGSNGVLFVGSEVVGDIKSWFLTLVSWMDSKTFLLRGFKQAPSQGLEKLTMRKQDSEEED